MELSRNACSCVTFIRSLTLGNLNVEVNIKSNNEIGELLTNMEITIESLRDIVGQVNRSSMRIGEMSESLNQVTNNSSTNATQLNNEMINISSAVDQ